MSADPQADDLCELDPRCDEQDEEAVDYVLRNLRSTLAVNRGGLTPDEDPDGFLRLAGPWWEEYLVEVPPGEHGDWEVREMRVEQWSGVSSEAAYLGRLVPPGTYTGLFHEDGVEYESGRADLPWMSDTPAEVLDHLAFVWRAHGRVLISGLGLGVALKAVLAKPCVTRVDVVEHDPDVVALVWPTYRDDPRVHLHLQDVWDGPVDWDQREWDVVWHDVWPHIKVSNLAEMELLEGVYDLAEGGWVGHWAKRECQWMQEREADVVGL